MIRRAAVSVAQSVMSAPPPLGGRKLGEPLRVSKVTAPRSCFAVRAVTEASSRAGIWETLQHVEPWAAQLRASRGRSRSLLDASRALVVARPRYMQSCAARERRFRRETFQIEDEGLKVRGAAWSRSPPGLGRAAPARSDLGEMGLGR